MCVIEYYNGSKDSHRGTLDLAQHFLAERVAPVDSHTLGNSRALKSSRYFLSSPCSARSARRGCRPLKCRRRHIATSGKWASSQLTLIHHVMRTVGRLLSPTVVGMCKSENSHQAKIGLTARLGSHPNYGLLPIYRMLSCSISTYTLSFALSSLST